MQPLKAPTRDFLSYNSFDEPQHHHSLHAQCEERTINFKSSIMEDYFCLIKAVRHRLDYFLLLLFQPPPYLTCQRSELGVPQNSAGATGACAAPGGWGPPTALHPRRGPPQPTLLWEGGSKKRCCFFPALFFFQFPINTSRFMPAACLALTTNPCVSRKGLKFPTPNPLALRKG